MPNHAHVTLIGHLGKDPEIRQAGQHQVVGFSIAVTTGFGEKKTTTWWNCQFWGERAVKVAQYLAKGKPVLVEGEPSERQYETTAGTKGKSLDVRVSNLVLFGSRDDAPAGAAPAADDANVPF